MSPLNTKSSGNIKITPHQEAETGEMNVIKVEVKPEGNGDIIFHQKVFQIL